MANYIRIQVPDAADLLNASVYGTGAIVRLQSSATETGTYANVTTAALVSGTGVYTLYDSTGTSTTFYRTRYENAGGTSTSDWSAAFQVQTAEANAVYASTANVKTRLGITGVAEDVVLDRLCDQVNAWIESETGRSLAPFTYNAALFDGSDSLEAGRLLPMPLGIRSISLLRVALYTGASFSTVPSTDYFIRPTSQERDPGWPGTELWMTDIPSASNTAPYFAAGYANVEITGTGGWASIPDEVIDVAETMVVRAYQARATGQTDILGADEMGRAVISRNVPSNFRRVLARYAIKEVSII